ncbi:MAG: alkaline phosphatase family protein [Bacteroidaceae bacterium]|nr:alkaline phosphatase family protein [Bacteroidaceae bacterium]
MKRILPLLTLAFLLASSVSQAKTRKALFIIVDGIPADNLERLRPPHLFDIAHAGHYSRAYCGGDVGTYSETPTISAIGYTNVLTGTWMNKHNVRGNSGIKANYNYWTLFRMAKAQSQPLRTAIFSSWTDNRTILLGENLEQTGHLKIDYVRDGYDEDKVRFPKRPHDLQIYDIDSLVCHEAAACVRRDAPDLSWVYLWYTDDAYHMFGNGAYSDRYVMKEDALIGLIWDAVRYREKNFDEEWLVLVTTDHGREDSGYGHGGQSERQRTIWMVTNLKKVNRQFCPSSLSHVDICPTIVSYLGMELPRDVAFEIDGTSFYGPRSIYDLSVYNYEDKAQLHWKADGKSVPVQIYMATENRFAEGCPDEWRLVGTTQSGMGTFTVDLSSCPSKFYKFQVVSPANRLTRWNLKDPKRPFAPQ